MGSGMLGTQVEMHNPHCFFISINLFIYSASFLYLYSLGPTPFQFFKTLLLKSSFLFFKVSFLRLSLSHVVSWLFFSIISLKVSAPRLALPHVLSLAFLKPQCSDFALSHVLFSFLKISALRLASNSPLAILLQQFFSLQQSFPFSNSFPLQKPPTPKSQKPKRKKLKAKAPKQKASKQKPCILLQ
jgi:hypothetical protein